MLRACDEGRTFRVESARTQTGHRGRSAELNGAARVLLYFYEASESSRSRKRVSLRDHGRDEREAVRDTRRAVPFAQWCRATRARKRGGQALGGTTGTCFKPVHAVITKTLFVAKTFWCDSTKKSS